MCVAKDETRLAYLISAQRHLELIFTASLVDVIPVQQVDFFMSEWTVRRTRYNAASMSGKFIVTVRSMPKVICSADEQHNKVHIKFHKRIRGQLGIQLLTTLTDGVLLPSLLLLLSLRTHRTAYFNTNK